jgi:phosphate transport system permease protein
MGMKKHSSRAQIVEAFFKGLMFISFLIVAGSLGLILWTILQKGLPALSWEMLSQSPQGGYYLGKGGGILNAILGSLYMAGGGTVLAFLLSLPIALYLETYLKNSRWGTAVRLALDVLWGIPSIVYGAFGFLFMLAVGLRASMLGGMVTLALLELPIMARAMDEIIRLMPEELEQAALALGSTKLEVALRVVTRQMLPGLITAVLLAFGRGIGDAASILFTAGYTDRMPTSLFRPAASLPLAIYFQLTMPSPEVQKRAYAAALILTVIVLVVSLGARGVARRLKKNVVK